MLMVFLNDAFKDLTPSLLVFLIVIRSLDLAESCFLPGVYSSFQCRHVGMTLLCKFRCPTGRRVFLGSFAIEDDLLVFAYAGQPLVQSAEGGGSFQ